MVRIYSFCLWPMLVLALLLPGWLTAGEAPQKQSGPVPKDDQKDAVFELKAINVLEEPLGSMLLRGQAAYCRAEPFPQVKKYPELHSKHPWYGEVVFGRDIDRPESGTTLYFVVDESGRQPGSKPEKEAESWLQKLADALSGKTETPEKASAPITYDRLYFDLNGDLDLTNDPVLQPQLHPSDKALPPGSARQRVAFSELAVQFDCGPGCGIQPTRILPRLLVDEYQGKPYATMLFLALTAKRGTIRIGSREYTALLGQAFTIAGRFDVSSTYLELTPDDGPGNWWEGKTLSAMRWVDGRFYTTRVTPGGDRFFVEPYRGEFGVFKIGPGDRKLDKLTAVGSFRSARGAVVVGDYSGATLKESEVQECRLPVGDYLPSNLSLNYGRLRIFLSQNYHADGRPRAVSEKGWRCVYGIKIRKDEPFVFDFSNKPEVLFATPAKDKTFHQGDEIQVKAVLVDPVLDIMIRQLSDTGRKEKKTVGEGANQQSYEQDRSLDPMVTITDSAGKTVAQGPMPFG